jgi:hypothetical protein
MERESSACDTKENQQLEEEKIRAEARAEMETESGARDTTGNQPSREEIIRLDIQYWNDALTEDRRNSAIVGPSSINGRRG